MDYTIKPKQFKRFFNVPCQVAEKCLKIADGNFIKVLLYIFSCDETSLTSEEIAKATNLSVSVVDDAILYLSNDAKLIDLANQKQEIVTSPSPSPQKEEIIQNKLIKKSASSTKYPPTYIKKAVEGSDDLKMLMDSIQSVFKRPITYTEQNAIINLYEYYGFPASVILILIDYCNNIGKSNVHYIEKIAQSWNENGIMTHEAAEAEIIRLIDRHTIENQVKSALSLTANLTPTQKQFIENWNSLGLSIDMITFASEKSIDNTGKIAFPYMNRILTNWADNGYKTREDVIIESKPKETDSNTKDHSYDLDEFYKMAMNYTPNNKGE